MFLRGNFPHIMAVQAIAKTISRAINVNCIGKHNCFFHKCGEKHEIKREMWELQSRELLLLKLKCRGGLDTKPATILTCVKVDKSIRHLVYDSLLVLGIKPYPNTARSALSSSACRAVDTAPGDVAWSHTANVQCILFRGAFSPTSSCRNISVLVLF